MPDGQPDGWAHVLDLGGDRGYLTFIVLLPEDFGGATDQVLVIFQDVVASTKVKDIGPDTQILEEPAPVRAPTRVQRRTATVNDAFRGMPGTANQVPAGARVAARGPRHSHRLRR